MRVPTRPPLDGLKRRLDERDERRERVAARKILSYVPDEERIVTIEEAAERVAPSSFYARSTSN